MANEADSSSNPAVAEQLNAAGRSFAAGKYKDAVSAFKKANKLQGDSCYQCWIGTAAAQMRKGEFKEAAQSADRALDTSKNDSDRAAAHNLKGTILRSSAKDPKDFAAVEAEYRNAVQLDRGVAVYHLNCATAMILQSKDEDARPELEACLAANPAPDVARLAHSLIADPQRGRQNFAPDFKVTVLSGEAVSLQQFSGKVLVMDFWATWCPPCRESVPELKELTKRYPAEKLVLMSVSVDDDDRAWHEFVAKKHMDWLQYRDQDHQLINSFGVRSFPTYLVIDGDGLIRQRLSGLNPHESVVHRLRETLESMSELKN